MENGKKIVTFGEIMLRLTPPRNRRFSQSPAFEANFGGSEANVAVSIANYGVRSEFITCLPANKIAEAAVDDLRSNGVETPRIIRSGDRMGLYYMETAAAIRSSQVVYDRAGSSFDALRPGMIDWEEAFRDAAWFHWSGIAAAVSASTAEVCAEAIRAARRRGLTVSCDINYRKNLWRYGKSAQEVLVPLLAECDVLFGTDDEYATVMGIEVPALKACEACEKLSPASYEAAARRVAERLPECKTIVFALRNVLNANHHTISGTLYTEGCLLTTRVYDIAPVVDCVGVGDAFVGGIIYSLYAGRTPGQALDFGAAACALKNTVPGDYNRVAVDEVDALANGSTSGRIAR
jgi:2-dehydro-3-deoxygluconokinase